MLTSPASNQLFALWLFSKQKWIKYGIIAKRSFVLNSNKNKKHMEKCLQNALATAILSRIEINGSASMDEPTCVIISVKYNVWSPIVVCIGGNLISGNPAATSPKIMAKEMVDRYNGNFVNQKCALAYSCVKPTLFVALDLRSNAKLLTSQCEWIVTVNAQYVR